MEEKNDISLLIIAKNEEMGLEKAITSCRDFVKEVIVSVDDASTDKTMEVARKFADKAIWHKWTGSFAEARNHAQKHVKTKWVLHLDGHEYVKKYDDLLENLKTDASVIFIKIIMESGFTFFYPRIVRKEVEWQHKVHNTPKAKGSVKYDNFEIIHDRVNLQSEEAKKIREKQRTQMLESELGPDIEKDKKNVRANFYLGNLYLDTKEWKKAIPYYKRVVKYGERVNQKWLACFHIGICYNEIKKPLHALYWFWKGEKHQPNRWENAKMLGTTYAFLGWNKKAIEHWIDSFKVNTGQFMFCPLSRNDAETWDFLSLAWAVIGEIEKSRIACRQALREERENGPGLLALEKIKILEAMTEQTQTSIEVKHNIEVCFLVYQRPERVPKILEQLKAQSIQNFKVNIWNNSGKELDINGFTKFRIHVTNSKENTGSQARFKLAKETTGNPIIFFDDDQDLSSNFVEYNYRQYLKFGPKCILGWFVRIFNQESYWKSIGAVYGQDVDYIATKAMIFDREIIDNEPLLQNIPKEFERVEDLYFCYLARMKYNMRMIKIEPYTREIPDGKDQWNSINKEKAFQLLRKKVWWLLADGVKIFGGFKFKIRKGAWDEQILTGEMNPSYYQIPQNPQVVVDIGAHIGGTAILAASLGADVYAYEPEQDNYNLLLENIKLNNLEHKIHCFKKGVGTPGKKTLYLNPKNSGMATFEKISDIPQGIEVIGIWNVFKDIDHCDLLKIDCEGAEYEFIKNLPYPKIDNISLELHKGPQQEIIAWLKKFYDVRTAPAIDGTSLMVFCTAKNPVNPLFDYLLTFKKVCEKLKVEFALANGTVFSIYRDGDFFKDDQNDIDIIIHEKFLWKIPDIIGELIKEGFTLTRHFVYKRMVRTLALEKNRIHIDVLITFKKGKEAYFIGPPTPITNKPYTAFVYPSYCFEKYDTINFRGVNFNTPYKIEDFLLARYGKDWRIPNPWGPLGHLNPKLSPSLRPNYEI